MPVDSYQKTLDNLCLVHPFNPAATQMLYGGQTLRVNNHFLLLEKPKLAALIQRVHLDPALGNYQGLEDGEHR